MKYAQGGYIPGPVGPAWKLEPGEYLFNRDGRIWRVSDDGERIEPVTEPQEKES